MKKTIFFIIIALVLGFMACAGNPSTSNNPIITIVNNTGFTIHYLFVSPIADDHWGQDRLGPNETINNGQSFSINLPYPVSAIDRYDILLITSDNDRYQKMNVLITENNQIIFNIRDLIIR